MKRQYAAILLLSTILILGGCTRNTSAQTERGNTETEQALSSVNIGGSETELSVKELRLAGVPWNTDALREAAPLLTAVESVEVGDCTPEELKTVRELFPSAVLRFQTELNGMPVDDQTASLDLRAVEESCVRQAVMLAELLPQLREITLPSADAFRQEEDGAGRDPAALWSVDSFDLLRQAAPRAELRGQFMLYGQLLSCESESVEIIEQNVGDEGLALVRKALPLLKKCRRFLLQDCDIDYALLAELRSEFPESHVTWRIHAGWCAAFTDAERIWMDELTNESAQALQYCTQVKYMDLGHNKGLSDVSFVEKMPELEVLILALTGVDDVAPLASCKKLEYLELYSSPELEDLSPLAACTELQHLNIGNLPKVNDITCLYSLPKLKRLRTGYDYIPKAQKEEIKKLMPNCTMLFQNLDPDQDGWRYVGGRPAERYSLLRQQMHYGGKSPYDERDLAYLYKYRPDHHQAFTRS